MSCIKCDKYYKGKSFLQRLLMEDRDFYHKTHLFKFKDKVVNELGRIGTIIDVEVPEDPHFAKSKTGKGNPEYLITWNDSNEQEFVNCDELRRYK